MELLDSGLFDGDLDTKKARKDVKAAIGGRLKIW